MHEVYALPRIMQQYAYLFPLAQIDISLIQNIALDSVYAVNEVEYLLSDLDCLEPCVNESETLIC